MKTGNQSFENSLRCLQHPLTLLSIALLLLNDHVFKTVSPSWLTGKLSDFAGLFFFPFIVAAGLSVLLSKFNFTPRVVGQTSFALVAIWFLLLKTFPFANSLTTQFASSFVGYQTQFSLDWTDLIGLTAMLPAWRLWNQSRQWKRSRFAYVALSIGVFASIATSPVAPTITTVTHLKEKNGSVFAFDMNMDTMAASKDGGKSWERVYDSDFELPSEYASLPIVECATNYPNECYRINGDEIVEHSKDGGTTWEISWELPADREIFFERANPDMDLGPYDMLIVQRGNQEYVLVAVGEEGILRKELPDGEWERIKVENAEPTPYRSTSISDAIALTYREIIIWFMLSIFAFHIACWLVWSAASKFSSEPLDKLQWIFSPALSPLAGMLISALLILLIGLIATAITQLLPFVFGDYDVVMTLLILLGLCALATLAFIPGTIIRLLKKWRVLLVANGYAPETATQLTWLVYLFHLTVFLAGCLVWILWAMGGIARYEVAMIFALISTCVIALIFFRKIKGLSKQIGSPPSIE
ncbi:MAG: hypothetical protein MHPDNHAH_02194 [Anaerolineales bacterium]|nr:hypothetical protein [Anaerolineales bacterium]